MDFFSFNKIKFQTVVIFTKDRVLQNDEHFPSKIDQLITTPYKLKYFYFIKAFTVVLRTSLMHLPWY